MARLGFGQIGGPKSSAAAPAKKNTGGFGSVGPVKAAPEGKSILESNEWQDSFTNYSVKNRGVQHLRPLYLW